MFTLTLITWSLPRIKFYLDWYRLQHNSFHPLSTASKWKFIWITQSTQELENVLKFIHICCEFTWVKTFSLKLIRIKILPGKTLSTLFSVFVFIQISSFWLLLLRITSKRHRRVRINFYPFSQSPRVSVVLDTLLLLIFNANVTILVLAKSEFTRVSIIIWKKNNKYMKMILHLLAAFGL